MLQFMKNKDHKKSLLDLFVEILFQVATLLFSGNYAGVLFTSDGFVDVPGFEMISANLIAQFRAGI